MDLQLFDLPHRRLLIGTGGPIPELSVPTSPAPPTIRRARPV